MFLIEPCIADPSLLDAIKKVGYTFAITEKRDRITILADSRYDVKRAVNKYKNKILFVRPLSDEGFRSAVKEESVRGLSFDNKNVSLINKKIFRTLKKSRKLVEVNVNKISFFHLSLLISASSSANRLLLSSCAENKSELWSPLSKVSLLKFIGLSAEDSIWSVYHLPRLLLKGDIRT
ncbi:hypothetical protein HS7_08390 [Sulfolobales archaeon HS-7]|nr:hypothetical protein HS7_08390 [Sulfolobales archaeon HS-7]